jgi:hypothetical protein
MMIPSTKDLSDLWPYYITPYVTKQSHQDWDCLLPCCIIQTCSGKLSLDTKGQFLYRRWNKIIKKASSPAELICRGSFRFCDRFCFSGPKPFAGRAKDVIQTIGLNHEYLTAVDVLLLMQRGSVRLIPVRIIILSEQNQSLQNAVDSPMHTLRPL